MAPEGRHLDDLGAGPPAILVGGEGGTTVSVARSLGRRGVDVHVLVKDGDPAGFSKYATLIETPARPSVPETWAAWLLGEESEYLRGSVLLACSDPAIEMLQGHREELAERYLLDLCNPGAQALLLDKWRTYQLALEAGVPTPGLWRAENEAQVEAHRDKYTYPVLVKPAISHKFTQLFPGRYLRANDFDELLTHCRTLWGRQLPVFLVEFIPGPDDLLCSYYTYVDGDGEFLVDFTKRVIRRYPLNSGLATYHRTDWIPEVRDAARRLLAAAGVRGLANVEFKRDTRDGTLKLIECNARFTAANGLVAEAGCDLAVMAYGHARGLTMAPRPGWHYREDLTQWRPGRDLLAFVQLRRNGGLTLPGWLRSVARPQTFAYFSPDDPRPWARSLTRFPQKALRQLLVDLRGTRS